MQINKVLCHRCFKRPDSLSWINTADPGFLNRKMFGVVAPTACIRCGEPLYGQSRRGRKRDT